MHQRSDISPYNVKYCGEHYDERTCVFAGRSKALRRPERLSDDLDPLTLFKAKCTVSHLYYVREWAQAYSMKVKPAQTPAKVRTRPYVWPKLKARARVLMMLSAADDGVAVEAPPKPVYSVEPPVVTGDGPPVEEAPVEVAVMVLIVEEFTKFGLWAPHGWSLRQALWHELSLGAHLATHCVAAVVHSKYGIV